MRKRTQIPRRPRNSLRRPNMSFGMPASWEECIELGIHPLTGEPLAAGVVVR